MNALVYVDIDHGTHYIGKNIKLHEMKKEKTNFGFSYSKNMANFEALL